MSSSYIKLLELLLVLLGDCFLFVSIVCLYVNDVCWGSYSKKFGIPLT
jgi:hypothetical protein